MGRREPDALRRGGQVRGGQDRLRGHGGLDVGGLQDGLLVQAAHDDAEQPLRDQLHLVAVEADQVVQVERGLWSGQRGAVGRTGGRVEVAQVGVGRDLVAEDGDRGIGRRLGRRPLRIHMDRHRDLR